MDASKDMEEFDFANFNVTFPDDNTDLDALLSISTQNLLFQRENSDNRFGPRVNETDLEKQRLSRIPKKTLQNNKFAMNVWRSWAFSRNSRDYNNNILELYAVVPIEIASTTEAELNFWLCRFVNEARRQDGSKYPPNTLYNIVSGIQRYLREECRRPEINFFDEKNIRFSDFRRTLDSVMKSLTTEGLGVVNHTENLSLQEENQLWESGSINKTSAKGLSYGVFFYNCKVFGFRGLTEHRQVEAQQYSFHTDINGNMVLTFQEHASKTVQGGLNQRKHEPKKIVQYSDPNNPRCIVDLFHTYLNCIPANGAFYRRPLVSKEGPKFSIQVVGLNTLGKYMQLMFNEAKIGKKVVNHSGRVYCCSTLYNAGFEEQEVMARSGHRSVAVRSYKRPSETKLQQISNALQPPAPKAPRDESPSQSAFPSNAPNDSMTEVNDSASDRERAESHYYRADEGVLRLNVPACIEAVIVVKNGKEIKITL